MTEPMLRLIGMRKQFPGVLALDWQPDEQLDLYPGEVVGLVGENGAGKSTLVQIIAGIYKRTSGEIWLDGQQYAAENAVEARREGIAIVMQEPALLPTLTVADNIFLGQESSYTNKFGLMSLSRRNAFAESILRTFGLDIAANTVVQSLDYERRKLVELAKATYQPPKILIIDETAAALSLAGQEILFNNIRRLKERNKVTVIYITHHLEEILRVCDRVVVMKDGKLVATLPVEETSVDELSTLMVGRELRSGYFRTDRESSHGAQVVLSVKNLSVQGKLKDISFDLYEGEILGLGGLVGAGAQEIGQAIFADAKLHGGEVRLNGEAAKISTPEDAVKLRIGYVPKDRDEEGLILTDSIRRNIALPIIRDLAERIFLNLAKEAQVANDFREALRIKAPSTATFCRNLSGGNRQKVVLSKWLAANSKVLILNNPTRGVDVGAKAEIYHLMMSLKQQGLAILMISEELPELLGMSDRIHIIRKGQISATFDRSHQPTEEEVIQYMI